MRHAYIAYVSYAVYNNCKEKRLRNCMDEVGCFSPLNHNYDAASGPGGRGPEKGIDHRVSNRGTAVFRHALQRWLSCPLVTDDVCPGWLSVFPPFIFLFSVVGVL